MRGIVIFVLLITALHANAQTEFSTYRLNATLPQANLVNPAFYPNHKILIGLPVVSSIYLSADNDRISFSDIFRKSESSDSLEIDTVNLFSKLRDAQRMQLKQSVQLFYFGYRGKRSYLSFSVHQVSETRFNFPGDLVGWAIRGPGSSHYLGKPLDFGNFYGRSVVYSKVSLNYSREITQHLRVGARFNYLVGIVAGETTELSGKLTMSVDSVNINTGRVLVQSAGFDFFDQDNLSVSDYKNYFLKGKNKGMSWDFGATYHFTDRLMVSASLNDLGYINWKEYTRSYEVDPINYTFRGFDVLDYLNQSGNDEFLQAEVDSLETLFTSRETTGGKFKTSLIGKFYAGVNYRLLKVNNVSALFYMDLFQKKISPAISLGYNLQLGRTLNATVGLTYQNGQISNVGAGLALKLTHMQFFATSDRANSFAYPARASRADLNFGMNLVFGKAKKKEKIDDNDSKDRKEEKPAIEESQALKDTVITQPPVEEPLPADTTKVSAPVIEPVIVDTVKTIEQPPIATETVTTAQPVEQEAKKEEPAIVEQEKKEEPPIVEPPVLKPEPRHEVVQKGNDKDELATSHYVIVGTFGARENAARYSARLRASGHDSQFGFITQKRVYYVYVFKSSDLDETRNVRDQLRKSSDFQFSESWVLTVME
jgi:cell division protein FtsN